MKIKRGKLLSIAVALVALAVAPTALADAVYHSERLVLEPIGAAPGSGMVVNIHPNGPQVYAHEIYTLKQTLPNTTYDVELWFYPFDTSCSSGVFFGSTPLSTNVAGNGQADRFITPEQIPPPVRGFTHGVKWIVTLAGVPQYETRCTSVTLD